jgi:hypothetical protein
MTMTVALGKAVHISTSEYMHAKFGSKAAATLKILVVMARAGLFGV